MSRPSRTFSLVLVVLGLLAILVARLELGLPDPHASVANHHLQHLFFVVGGALWGIALGRALARPAGDDPSRRDVWLIPAILAPAAVMFAMWPTSYPYIEARPFLHFIEHMVFIVLSAVATYSAYRYAQQIGWVQGVTLSAMALLAVYGFGVTPGPNPLVAAVAAAATPPPGAGLMAEGQAVYDRTCAGCHMPQGTGLPGAFPPLAGHVPTLAAAEGGRDYLVRVVLFGLQGPITAGGQSYGGVMPPWSSLSDDEVAAVLEYVSGSWGNQPVAGQAPFSAAEVATARGDALSSQDVFDLRQRLALP